MPHIQNLLRPTQVGLPDDLEQAVRQTITAWESQAVEQAYVAMNQLVSLAQAHHLLPATPIWAIN